MKKKISGFIHSPYFPIWIILFLFLVVPFFGIYAGHVLSAEKSFDTFRGDRVEVYTDKDTGIEYLVFYRDGNIAVTPRLKE